MIPKKHHQILLKSRPHGIPQADNFEIVECAIPEIEAGQLLIRNQFLSVEPAMRGWVNAVSNYSELVAIGDVMRAFAAGEVVASRNPAYQVGDRVVGMLGWQEYAISNGGNIRRKVREIDLPLSLSLGVLGLNGMTAYLGLMQYGEPKLGDTVVVSSAAGAVGSTVGQLAKLAGCRVVGITGGEEKVRQCLEEFGYDAAINYRSSSFEEQLDFACPAGVDVYFDNTSGSISDAVIMRINREARIVICGTASFPSWDPWPTGPRVERHLLVKRARMQGFINLDHDERYEEIVQRLVPLVRNGRLKYREEVLFGLGKAPGSIADLYAGANMGKRLIQLYEN